MQLDYFFILYFTLKLSIFLTLYACHMMSADGDAGRSAQAYPQKPECV